MVLKVLPQYHQRVFDIRRWGIQQCINTQSLHSSNLATLYPCEVEN